jgi:hypothetical protein
MLIVEMKVLSNEGGADEKHILVDLTQQYVFKVGGAEKTVRSLVTLQRGEGGLITLHEEEWDHEPNKYSEDGFLGKIQEARKRMGATLIDKMVSSNPNKV